MRRGRRIRTIYAKELIELLRDHRTLIAMIVVPIALYPLLIIGSVHLLSVQDVERQFAQLQIAVQEAPSLPPADRPISLMRHALERAQRIIRQSADPEAEGEDERLESIGKMKIVEVGDVKQAVAEGYCDVGVSLRMNAAGTPQHPQHFVRILYDKAEVRSESAMQRVRDVFLTVSDGLREHYLAEKQLPSSVVEPIQVEAENVAPPRKVGGMVLGSIVPLVLVLMTITGAIYPAIDLTAGERERGTLETLMVCPVPPIELITGKYLVVTTVALLGAALNLLSMGATLYFGGFTDMIGSSGETELPLGVLPVLLVALIPFALLFSAVMVAVCSYARTFKEAQNYIMPVILAALIPGGIAAMPGTELQGVNTVVPVMNMVLMARELLLGHYNWSVIGLVMVSTSLYAATAVIIASHVFSTESAVFADSVSLKAAFSRRLMRPEPKPGVSLTLIVVAILFPVWIFVQVALQPNEGRTLLYTFQMTALLMPVVLVLFPAAVLGYFKTSLKQTFAVRGTSPRFLIGAVLIGVAAWIPAHELFVLQGRVLPIPEGIFQSEAQMREAMSGYPLVVPLLLIAIVPALCEELFFRGFVLSGLGTAARKWMAIVATACIFAIFHIVLVKFALTAGLGLLLGYLCWQSRSIWPAVIAHMLHNATAVLIAFWPTYSQTLGIADRKQLDHLPMPLVGAGILLVVVGVLLVLRPRREAVHAGEAIAPAGA